jgi:hypothetical protein
MAQSKITKPVIIEHIDTIDIPGGRLGYHFQMSNKSKNITVTISNGQNCCEEYGVHTISDMNSFIGATYNFVDIKNVADYKGSDEVSQDLKIYIHTDRGVIYIQFYNSHNGYYTHDVSIKSEHGHCYEAL